MYYKTTKPEVVAALKVYKAALKALQAAADAFAQKYNATAIFSFDINERKLHGLQFKESPNDTLWCRPDNFGCQRPRASPRTKKQEDKDACKALNEQWKADFPELSRVDNELLYKPLGMDWGVLMFDRTLFQGFIMDDDGDTAYIQGHYKFDLKTTGLIEIMGSEYMKAAQ